MAWRMDMKNLRLIAIDLDKTLLKNDKTFDVKRLNKVLYHLQEKDIIFSFITGHERADAHNYLRGVDKSSIYLASHNGNYIEYSEKCIYKALIPTSEVLRLLYELANLASLPLIMDSGNKIMTLCTNNIEDFLRGNQRILCEEGLLKLAVKLTRIKDEIKPLIERLNIAFPNIDIVYRCNEWLEFHLKTEGKGDVIKYLQGAYKISPEKSMCLGNHRNDISMMKHCKYNISMSNGHPELKKVANYVIGSNEEQAVTKLLEEINSNADVNFITKYLV